MEQSTVTHCESLKWGRWLFSLFFHTNRNGVKHTWLKTVEHCPLLDHRASELIYPPFWKYTIINNYVLGESMAYLRIGTCSLLLLGGQIIIFFTQKKLRWCHQRKWGRGNYDLRIRLNKWLKKSPFRLKTSGGQQPDNGWGLKDTSSCMISGPRPTWLTGTLWQVVFTQLTNAKYNYM